MQDPATLQLLFDCYCAATPPQSSRVLEALLLFSSVRRSLFASDAERIRFLGHLLELVRTSKSHDSPLYTGFIQGTVDYHSYVVRGATRV